MIDIQAIGQRIKSYRENAKLTQDNLAHTLINLCKNILSMQIY